MDGVVSRPGEREASCDQERSPAIGSVAGNLGGGDQPEVEWLDGDSMEDWDRFVASHPAGNLQQTSEWKRVLEGTYSHIRGRVAVIRRMDGKVCAGMAVYTVRSALFGNRLVSVPFASISEPLVSRPEQLLAFVRFLNKRRAESGFSRVEIRLNDINGGALPDGTVLLRAFNQHALDLSRGEDALYRNLSRTCVQSGIQKAARGNVVVHAAGLGQTEWDSFYTCYVMTRQRLGLPAMPWRFFSAIRDHVSPDSFVLQLAMRQSEVLGAGLSLVYNGTWLLEWVGDSPAGRKLGANQALYWMAIRAAVARGCHTFSFGRTATSNEGLRAYKRHWGAVERDLPILLVGESSSASHGPGSVARWQSILKPVLAGSPPMLYRILSRWCYRHLG